MADLLSIGLSGLTANKTSLAVTGHNITNVNTPGFSRQDAVQATRNPQFSGAGYIGSGTTLVDIRRSYSEFLSAQVRSSTALSSDVEAYRGQIEQLDSLLAGTTTGITPSLQKLFSSLQTAAEDPANIPARQLVLSEAQGLARRFNTVADRITEQNSFINKQMSAVSDQVNRLATSIASYNDAIAKAAANGQQPNDLLDAREEAVRQLSTFVGVTVVAQDDNSLNLFVGTGQPLVVGNSTSRLEVVPGQGDPLRFEVNLVNGGSSQGITSLITGGELGGLIRYRAETLDPTLNSLGRLALAVSDQVNTQLGQGLDLKGQVGSALFGDFNDPALASLRARAFSTNTGSVQPALNITDTSVLTTSDYRLEYDGTTYTARRLSDGEAMTVIASPLTTPPSSVPASYPATLTFTDKAGRGQGFELALGSEPVAGDKFLLQPTRRGATTINAQLDQPDQLAFAAPLRSAADLQNRGNAVIGQPQITNTLEPMRLSNLKAIDSIELTFDSVNGRLQFTSPLPAGVTITSPAMPAPPAPQVQTIGVTSGQNNQLSYVVEVDDGVMVQSYTISQSFSGRPENGDKFTLGFNSSGVSDNRNALKLVDLQNKQTVGVDPTITSIGTGVSFTDGYGDLVERVGTLTAQSRQDSEATGAILKQATNNRDSLSAVNLDEEAANLIKFEQYYNASAQVIQVARSLFDTLINTFR
ncbi:flagellar hook-associated protein 1 FlgK [Pseudomonas guineae]|uniref:Flagellar hook-associated protein 1 n=1 Tax=Pseudomonas guineae TaxID=425504 RepID=A0A1I3D0B7_9PSED|nr:flagellar hook-associated protein FlgK [Pseudomonas guineae]SFH80210.1 flagellar hook-associated protein 1 FlgK [Pseudomonas guineae]